ncbi:MAG TPA: hypothetical protein VF746_31930 [Longimicrobium sp.]|jgi:hypothetical protein
MRWTLLAALAILLPALALARPPAPFGPPSRAQEVRVCATVGDELRELPASIDPATGDTLVSGKPLREVVPEARYAQGQPWFERREAVPVPVSGASYTRRAVQWGLPRSLSPSDLREPGFRRVGTFQGVDIFEPKDQESRIRNEPQPAELHGITRSYYVPVSAGCLFQQYYNEVDVGPVRG